jgi:hypothetical protein
MMLLSLHCLLWGAIGTFGVFLATSPPLAQALKENWRSLAFIILLAFMWRLPFEGHFFYGLEYEDSYIYPVAARYLASNKPHAEPTSSPYLTTVCAVGNWTSCRNPETSSGHFIGYPFIIVVVAKVFGYNPTTASAISVAASLIAVVSVFLVGKLLDPSGVSGLAGALIFSVTPIFAVQGGSTYAEPLSNMLVVTSLLLCLYLFSPFIGSSRSPLIVTWLALTFTSLLAIVVKRENFLIVPMVLLTGIVFGLDEESGDAPKARLPRVAALVTIFICTVFVLTQLRLLTVIRREQVEYSMFPFSFEVWRTMMPAFLRAYLTLGWYMGSVVLVVLALFTSIRSRTRGLYVVGLFVSYLLLYTSHVRSYYQLHGGAVTIFETIRYSMNLAGVWSIMAGLGLSTVILGASRIEIGEGPKLWVRRITWVCLACLVLCSWVVTDRLKEDMVAAEIASRLRPAEAALQTIERNGNPDTFVITLEPLLVQMLAHDPTNVIDFKDLTTGLLGALRAENPNATFFYLEQDIYNTQADRERYRKSFNAVEDAHKMLLMRGEHYAIFEILQ